MFLHNNFSHDTALSFDVFEFKDPSKVMNLSHDNEENNKENNDIRSNPVTSSSSKLTFPLYKERLEDNKSSIESDVTNNTSIELLHHNDVKHYLAKVIESLNNKSDNESSIFVRISVPLYINGRNITTFIITFIV